MVTQAFHSLSLDADVARIDLSSIRHRLVRSLGAVIADSAWPAEELEYRRFLTLKQHYPGLFFIPSALTSRLWQAHILDTRADRADCDAVFGRYLDHFPYLGQQDPADRREAEYAMRCYSVLHRRHFRHDLTANASGALG